MRLRFLLDENLTPQLGVALLRLDAFIDVLRVGDDVLPVGSLDPEVLAYLEKSQRLLVTNNRVSMPGHLRQHWLLGRHIYGLLWTRPKASIGTLAKELHFIWETTEAEEWIDRLDWIPLR